MRRRQEPKQLSAQVCEPPPWNGHGARLCSQTRRALWGRALLPKLTFEVESCVLRRLATSIPVEMEHLGHEARPKCGRPTGA